MKYCNNSEQIECCEKCNNIGCENCENKFLIIDSDGMIEEAEKEMIIYIIKLRSW